MAGRVFGLFYYIWFCSLRTKALYFMGVTVKNHIVRVSENRWNFTRLRTCCFDKPGQQWWPQWEWFWRGKLPIANHFQDFNILEAGSWEIIDLLFSSGFMCHCYLQWMDEIVIWTDTEIIYSRPTVYREDN